MPQDPRSKVFLSTSVRPRALPSKSFPFHLSFHDSTLSSVKHWRRNKITQQKEKPLKHSSISLTHSSFLFLPNFTFSMGFILFILTLLSLFFLFLLLDLSLSYSLIFLFSVSCFFLPTNLLVNFFRITASGGARSCVAWKRCLKTTLCVVGRI
jgi:hypothetical protein